MESNENNSLREIATNLEKLRRESTAGFVEALMLLHNEGLISDEQFIQLLNHNTSNNNLMKDWVL